MKHYKILTKLLSFALAGSCLAAPAYAAGISAESFPAQYLPALETMAKGIPVSDYAAIWDRIKKNPNYADLLDGMEAPEVQTTVRRYGDNNLLVLLSTNINGTYVFRDVTFGDRKMYNVSGWGYSDAPYTFAIVMDIQALIRSMNEDKLFLSSIGVTRIANGSAISYAEQYVSWKISLDSLKRQEELTHRASGDVDGDGKITSNDLAIVRALAFSDGKSEDECAKLYNELLRANDSATIYADINQDGRVGLLDFIDIVQ